jgi:hypothetical protein
VSVGNARDQSDVLGEIAEHLAAVLVDLFRGGRWTVLGPHAVSRLKRLVASPLFDLGGYGGLQDPADVTISRYAFCLRLRLKRRPKVIWKLNGKVHGKLPLFHSTAM